MPGCFNSVYRSKGDQTNGITNRRSNDDDDDGDGSVGDEGLSSDD